MYISRIIFVAILLIFSCDETLEQTLEPEVSTEEEPEEKSDEIDNGDK